jgi:hypothetical protein
MSRHQKALARLLQKPRDFTWAELRFLMETFNYEMKTGSGSSRKFIHRQTAAILMMHEPHPAKVLKTYQIKAAIDFLKQEKHIK